ncbi:MAG: ketopantoate reductase family protein [bacterium]
MRVLIAGAGALGSVFGGFLRRAGDDVTLLGRAAHVDVVARHGLHLDGLWGAHHVTGFTCVSDAARLDGHFDAILLPVKAPDTAVMARAVAPHLAAGGVMLSLQNGLGNVEAIEAVVGAERTLGARVIFGATVTAPGHALVTVFADPTAIGSLDASADAAREATAQAWATRLAAAGVPSVYTDRLPARLWAKVFYSAALNPLGALLRVHYGALPERPATRAVVDAVLDEAFAVAAADGVDLPWHNADAYRDEFYGRLVPATYDHRSSMLQDLARGRRTEIDAISGEIARRGQLHGIATPVNEALSWLIHAVEDRGRRSEP